MSNYIKKYIKSRLFRFKNKFKKITDSRINLFFLSFIIVTLSLTTSNWLISLSLIFLLLLKRRLSLFILLGVLISTLNFLIFNKQYLGEISFINEGNIEMNATVTSDSVIKDFEQEVILKTENLNGLIIAKLTKYPTLYRDDEISITGKLSLPQNISDKFDYVSYLKSKKIFFEFKGDILSHKSSDNLFSSLRSKFNNIISSSINPSNSELLSGILYGSKNNFTEDFKEDLRNSGLFHIVSISGFNFTIIYSALLSLTIIINRKIVYLMSIPFLIGFLILVGIDNIPAQRATIIIIISIIGLLMGRKVSTITLLLFSLVILLIEYPLYWTNLSFLLSFAAFSGLILLSGIIANLLKRIKLFPISLIDIISSTIAAITLTSLITLYFFGELNLVSLISNIFVLPLITLTTFAGIFLLASGLINFQILIFFLSKILDQILEVMRNIIIFFGSIKLDNSIETIIGIASVSILAILIINNDYKKFINTFK